MCFYSKLAQDALKVAARYKATYPAASDFIPKQVIKAFDYPATPIITDTNPTIIQNFNWGLIPPNPNLTSRPNLSSSLYLANIQDIAIRKYTLNARIETVKTTKSFMKSVDNRCLVIADGFYEWQHVSENGKIIKRKFLITNSGIFSFAGLYSCWTNPATGQIYNTYTILTTQANDLMSQIHNFQKRMPVILKVEDEKNGWPITP